jgi:hypothetical protein
VPYREGPGARGALKRFDYVPRARRWFHWIFDIVIITAVLYGVWKYAWHWEVACSWQGNRASCTRVSEDSLGRRKVQDVQGIRGLAYEKDLRVGFVTDADHADELALFATNEILVGTPEEADELRRFGDERYPKSVAYRGGLPRPVLVTAFGLLAILGWAFFTRTRRYRVTVDPGERVLTVDRGILRGTERFELATTKVELEHGGGGTHRVALRTKDGVQPITDAYHSGTHHGAFVRAVTAAMAG